MAMALGVPLIFIFGAAMMAAGFLILGAALIQGDSVGVKSGMALFSMGFLCIFEWAVLMYQKRNVLQ